MIEVENLQKKYVIKEKKSGFLGGLKNFINPNKIEINAVKNISFTIKKGEVAGFVGRNGAGKSTTIKMLSGILYPTAGTVKVNNLEPYKHKKENAMNMGVVFGQRSQLWWDIPIIDTFELLQKMYRIKDIDYKRRLNSFVDMFEMQNFLYRPVRQLSLGQRICADLCAAMLHNPGVLYLDEPTIGLDIINKERIRNFIKEINKEFSTTVILTSHDIDDIELLADRLMIINHGELIYNDTLKKLKEQYSSQKKVIMTVLNPKLVEEKLKMNTSVLKTEINENGEIVCTFNENESSFSDIIENVGRISGMKDIKIVNFSLEEFISKTLK